MNSRAASGGNFYDVFVSARHYDAAIFVVKKRADGKLNSEEFPGSALVPLVE